MEQAVKPARKLTGTVTVRVVVVRVGIVGKDLHAVIEPVAVGVGNHGVGAGVRSADKGAGVGFRRVSKAIPLSLIHI